MLIMMLIHSYEYNNDDYDDDKDNDNVGFLIMSFMLPGETGVTLCIVS